MRMLASILMVCFVSLSVYGADLPILSLTIKADPVAIDAADINNRTFGRLKYLYGAELTSNAEIFGGLSGLIIEKTPKGRRLVMLGDKGGWFTADLGVVRDSITLSAAKYAPYAPSKIVVNNRLKMFDGEGLTLLKNGDKPHYLVAFESLHALYEYDAHGAEGIYSPYNNCADFSGGSRNGGLEAITITQAGKLLAFKERGQDIKGRLPVYLCGDGVGEQLYFQPPKNHAPTAARTLPNGDVILLTRRYNLIDGLGIKLLRIKAADIKAGATLIGTDIATFTPPLTIDNMEAMDFEITQGGRIILYMLSDNNFNTSIQKTLLLVFELIK